MNRMVRALLFAGALAGVLTVTSQANAGWHHHWGGYYAAPYVGWTGYSYAYYGGGVGVGCCGPTYAAYVPTYGCYDPCYTPCYRGCGLLSRWAYRCRTRHYAYYGGWCAPTCCNVCGYDDCCCGTSGSIIDYGTPIEQGDAPAMEGSPTPAPEGDQKSVLPEKQTSLTRDSALLTVNVPGNARIFVNGIATRSQGNLRRYVSRNLTPGFDYTYEVKAEMIVDGKPVTQSKTVRLRAGQQAKLAFDMRAQDQLETALTLHVPDGAKVYLAGNQTNGNGPVRVFRTTKLADGDAWSDYVVRVVVNENGVNREKEERITLRAGEKRELTFDFDVDKIASAR